ncbi:MAG: hypothetical protein ACKOCW_10525 [Planctomycetaceae bacterium]
MTHLDAPAGGDRIGPIRSAWRGPLGPMVIAVIVTLFPVGARAERPPNVLLIVSEDNGPQLGV